MEHDTHCLAHGKRHRSEFQFILNFVRGKVTDKSLNFACASSVVCCCKNRTNVLKNEEKVQNSDGKNEKEKIENFFKEDELKDAMKCVLAMEDIPTKVKDVLNKWNNRSQDADGLVLYGNNRIAGLILLCLKGNYKLLENSVPDSGRKNHEMSLPINSSLLGVFFGRRGKNIKDLCMENKFLVQAEKRSSSSTLDDAKITVICKDAQFETVKKLLLAKAKELLQERQKKKIAYEQHGMSLLAKRRKRRRKTGNRCFINPKEFATEKFSRRYQSRIISRADDAKIRTKSPLTGSECFHCQMPFSDRNSESSDPSLPFRCRYHRGYVVFGGQLNGQTSDKYGRWSCCELPFKKSDDVAVFHQRSGCTTAETHFWRPVKDRKNCKKIVKFAGNCHGDFKPNVFTIQRK